MKSREVNTKKILGQALGKGCLAGLGLVVAFFVIGAIIFGVLSLFGITDDSRLFYAVAGGPIIGTVILFIVALVVTIRTRRSVE
jgi:hypothetical protein